MISLGALYRRQNLVGVILLKIQGEMSTVGSASHRWMRGTKWYSHVSNITGSEMLVTVTGHAKRYSHVCKPWK